MIDSIDQRRKDIREVRNKLTQLQICKMKNIYEYINWYYDAFDSNMNDNLSKYIL